MRCVIAAAALVTALAAAAVSLTAQNSPSPRAPQAPPRDATAQSERTGSGVIRGRVLAGDTGRPLRRARVMLSGGFGGQPRTISTGLDGRYELRDLPAGRFTLQVERSGYLTLRYGQLRPLEQGRPLDLRDREALEGIDFTLPRAASVSGRVIDELGDPIAGVSVFAMRTAFWEGRRRLVPAGMIARTDDIGEYRITALTPGTYVLMATFRETWTVREDGVERTLGYAPTYFPGTAAIAEAQRITVRAGQQLGAIDLALVPGRAASISGVALDAAGRPLGGRTVVLGQEVSGPAGQMVSSAGFAVAAADGTFAIRNIPPGQYRLRVRAPTAPGGTAAPEFVAMPITLDGVDVTNLTLTTSSGWSISGHVVGDDGAVPQGRAGAFRLVATPVDPEVAPDDAARSGDPWRVGDDWTFSLTDIFGPVRLRATVPEGWWVKAILHDGRDVADTPTQAPGGGELRDVRIVVSRRATLVSGRLVDEKGAPVQAGTVLVFARDAGKWFPESRWVKAARPDQAGTYRIDGLPPGEYFGIALDYVEEGAWHDPDFIDALRDRAQPFALGDAESRSLPLKITVP